LTRTGQYDYDTIHSIIDSHPILQVAFPPDPNGDDPFPAVIPMLGCTGIFDPDAEADKLAKQARGDAPGAFIDDDEAYQAPKFPEGPRFIYLHGHAAARMFTSPKASGDGRIPVTVAAASIQGIVLALAPFHNSCNYTSAVVQGYASQVTLESERLFALTLITDNLVPGRWDNSRNPPTKAELTSTGVLKVEIESASVKTRTGEPGDDRPDLKNQELMGRVWTGVLPCWTQYGEPVKSSYNEARLPGYLGEFVQKENEKGKHTAKVAIETIAKKK
jgi:nitroimidazol reductase NimA-like FMN-containing flavoprotein (pyridoxamine 5'-phosphate oxidase superfamily)